jgi:hypothetical protein
MDGDTTEKSPASTAAEGRRSADKCKQSGNTVSTTHTVFNPEESLISKDLCYWSPDIPALFHGSSDSQKVIN